MKSSLNSNNKLSVETPKESLYKKANQTLESEVREEDKDLNNVLKISNNDALTHEIKKREQMQDMLRESEEKFQKISASAQDAIIMLDNDEKISYWNKAYERIFGYSREEVEGKNIHELIIPERFRKKHLKAFERFKATGVGNILGKTVEVAAIRKDGAEILIELSLSPVNIKGKWNAIGIIRDITKRKKLGEALSNAAREWRTTFDAIGDAVSLLDKDGKIVRCNKAMADIARKPFGEIHGRSCCEFTYGTVEHNEECPTSKVMKTHKRESCILAVGDSWFNVIVDPVLDENGTLVGFCHIMSDITERKKLEKKVEERTKELITLNKHLEKASRAKSEFLANMSHELRTPLNSVIGFADVLQAERFGELTEKQARYVANILTAGQDLLSLINDILDLSKIEAGKIELALSEFSFPKLIESIKTILKELAFGLKITIESHIAPEISIVKADERKIKQIMYNLLSNAIKSTPNGGKIDVRADIKDKELRVSVTDTGIGIKEEDIDKLFETFRQIESEYTQKHWGTGLGLALTKDLVQLHHGKIWVESEFGKGSTFTFTIPLMRKNG
jgi:PAS domain S-box-containing protein